MKRSIFLSLVLILTMGGFTNALRTLATDTGVNNEPQITNVEEENETTQTCSHEQIRYENLGLTHTGECLECEYKINEEAHVDENNDMCCDACGGNVSTLAPSEGEVYVETEMTLSEGIKISFSFAWCKS